MAGPATPRSERNVVSVAPLTWAVLLSLALACFSDRFLRERMFLVPPWIIRPIDWRAVAGWRAAFQPELALVIFPDAHRMAVETFAAVQTPFLVIEVRPAAGNVVVAQPIQLFVVGQFNVVGHGFASARSVCVVS